MAAADFSLLMALHSSEAYGKKQLMDNTRDGGPAFPQPMDDMGTLRAKTEGMSLRDWLAGQAIAAITDNARDEREIDIVTNRAYRIADAMLRAREAK